MFLMKELKEYPEGSDILLDLLDRFYALRREQIIIYFMQTDKTFNRNRVLQMLEALEEMELINEDSGLISLNKKGEVNEDTIKAFWAFLHYASSDTKFEAGRYPSEIVFTDDDSVHEIIAMNDDDSLEKMDFLSKRKPRNNACHYHFLFTSGTIDEFDDELFPDVDVTLITYLETEKEVPKLTYHEVEFS